MSRNRPMITSPCPADALHADGERIAEVAFPSRDGGLPPGCLISMRWRGDRATIEIYRADPEIQVIATDHNERTKPMATDAKPETEPPTTTYQLTLAATAHADAARDQALERIQQIMAPGARAIAASRTPDSPYWLEERREIPGLGVTLWWKDQGTNENGRRAPYDRDRGNYMGSYANGRTWSAQITGADRGTPELLAHVATVARILTEEIRLKYEAITAAQVSVLEDQADRFQAIAPDRFQETAP